jgi:hypothetical protein
MPKQDNKEIKKSKLILAEGTDAFYFLINLLDKLKIDDFQVFDYGGITELTMYIENQLLKANAEKFKEVTTLLIVRDSEQSSESAGQSINTSLQTTKLANKKLKPFLVEKQNELNIGFMLFPGFDDNNNLCEQGTLEDLCVKILKDQNLKKQIEEYIRDFKNKSKITFKREHKNILHSCLSFTDEFVGLKLAEALKANGYNLDSPYLKPFVDVIRGV